MLPCAVFAILTSPTQGNQNMNQLHLKGYVHNVNTQRKANQDPQTTSTFPCKSATLTKDKRCATIVASKPC